MTCAHQLQAAGASVTLFEKSRGPGGRLSTRRREGATFDHGAQYFSARSEAFVAAVSTWEAAGTVARWEGRFATFEGGELRLDQARHPRFVGTPKMSSLGRYLSQGLDIRLETRIEALEGRPHAWILRDTEGRDYGPYALVLISAPGPQALALLPKGSRLRPQAEAMTYAPCWAVMAEFEREALSPWDGVKLSEGALAWAARDSSKPGRPPGERWVLHASPQWTRDHLEDSPESVIEALSEAFGALGAPSPQRAQAHRCRYALSAPHPGPRALFETPEGLGLMGDGLVAPRVEAAWESAMALSDLIIGTRDAS